VSDDLPIRPGFSSAGSSVSQQRPGGLFSDLLGFEPFRDTPPGLPNASGALGVEISRTDDGYTVEIPVPGFRPEQIEVIFQDDLLVISGKGERRSFTRQLALPEETDPDGISANCDYGMLTLTLPRRPETQPRRIQITSATSGTGNGSSATPK
jgi:HSP20 family protein